MSSTPQTPSLKDKATPLTALPTLHIIPSYTYTPSIDPTGTGAALLPVPAAAEAALQTIVRSADVTRSTSAADVNVVNVDHRDLISFIESEPSPLDPEFEDYFVPPPPPPPVTPQPAPSPQKEKGKRKAVPLPAPASTSSHPAASGSSPPVHPFHSDAGYQPDEFPPKDKYANKDHRTVRENLNGLLTAGTKVHDAVGRVSQEVKEVLAFVPAMQAQINELTSAPTIRDDDALATIIQSQNSHAQNIQQTSAGVNDITTRLLPALMVRIRQLEHDNTSLKSTVRTLELAALAPVTVVPAQRVAVAPIVATPPAPPVVVPAPPAVDPAVVDAVIGAYLAATGKRGHEEDLAADARNVRPRTEYTNAPALRPPPALPAAPLAPPAAPLAPPAALLAPPPQYLWHPPMCLPLPPARHLLQRWPLAPKLLLTHLPVVFGPVSWHKDAQHRPLVKQDITALLAAVIPDAANYEFSTRRYKRLDAYTIVTFASAEIANWVVDAWTHENHGPYKSIHAVHPNA
ncbi:hypothetical protein MVEN_02344800 [Mycena venus]|uniref:Uncharacterized protein n=1 Tax=Mycena venus TaxID=2733690 RepID=A0A8H6X490_9AGAR|nr:hypothetical protein MVEN_02344800 [Mycena venus]